MVSRYPQHLDFQAISKTGHWSPVSQKFAGVHNLFWALDQGWQMEPDVTCVRYPCQSTRSVPVYRFVLHRDPGALVMPVIDSPHLLRLIAENGLCVQSAPMQGYAETAGV